ncbi:MAG: PAS domain-containing sensor histidine kinase, partial [Victivallaceae bacterium]
MSITVSDKKFTELDEEVLRNCIKLFLLARERERRKLELKHALLLQEMISSYSDIPILLFDAHGKLLNINQAGCEMFSLTRHEALDLPCCQTICRTPAPPPNCPMNTVLRTGKFAEFHWSRGGRDYHVSAKPIFDEQKKLLYVLESGIDITEANLTQRKLIAAMEAAKEGERAKSDFISTMNHELRTPLNAVIGFSELLQTREMSSAEQSESLQAIKNSGKALLNLLNDVLDISQLDAERFAFSPVKTDILALLLELASIFQISAEKKNLDFKLLMPDALPELYVDPARIRQAIVNVVGNALKFTRIGSVVLAVRFDFVASDSGNLQIEVEDTGIGIKNELLEKIFEPFWQDDQVRDSRAYQGSGLGLAITQKLVNAMNGEISVVSCKNIGSTFTMTFNAVKFISPLPPETTQERVG